MDELWGWQKSPAIVGVKTNCLAFFYSLTGCNKIFVLFLCFYACSLLSCGHMLGKGSFVVLYCEIVTVPFGILCQVWYLIVSIHDLYPILTFILYA